MKATFELEAVELQLHGGPIAGIDEAGRGPLAGPVVAAAVILDPDAIPEGIADSKTLDAEARERVRSTQRRVVARFAQAVQALRPELGTAQHRQRPREHVQLLGPSRAGGEQHPCSGGLPRPGPQQNPHREAADEQDRAGQRRQRGLLHPVHHRLHCL